MSEGNGPSYLCAVTRLDHHRVSAWLLGLCFVTLVFPKEFLHGRMHDGEHQGTIDHHGEEVTASCAACEFAVPYSPAPEGIGLPSTSVLRVAFSDGHVLAQVCPRPIASSDRGPPALS